MTDATDDPGRPDGLSDSLLSQIDSLAVTELEQLLSYVENRMRALQDSIEHEITATATGEVLDIEKHGTYALVQKHPPDPDGEGVNTDIVSLYHVRREKHPDGEDTLHWAYIGDLNDEFHHRCETCGRTFDTSVTVCPHCGSGDVEYSEGDE